jgi:hypothetical protein
MQPNNIKRREIVENYRVRIFNNNMKIKIFQHYTVKK